MRALILSTFAAALTLWPQFAPAAVSVSPLYERTLMLEADRRCGLFTPPVAATLRATARQAEAAALRDHPASDVRAVQARALAKARGAACGAPDLLSAAGRVRVAHADWSKLPRMTFPGVTSEWRADRGVSPQARWRLAQTLHLGRREAVFGLAAAGEAPPQLLAVARFGKRPAFARLRLGKRTFLAESRRAAPKSLRKDGRGEALAFRFPAAATQALEQLDPGQTARLDFVATDWSGEHASSFGIEVGDFAAARHFLDPEKG